MQCGIGSRSISVPLATFKRPEIVKFDAPCINLLPPPPHAPSTHLNSNYNFRVRSSVTRRLQRLTPASSSKTDPPIASDETPTGPPLLTILFGLLVFLIVCWIVGSVAMWLLSLFVSLK